MKHLFTCILGACCLAAVAVLLWLDRLCQKTLAAAVPDVDRLRTEPASFLAAQDVAIGPKKKYIETLMASAIWTIFTLLPVGLIWALVMSLVFDKPPANMSEEESMSSIAAMAALCFVGSLIGSYYLLRGGRLVLNKEGVVFAHRSRTVFCPWSFLNVSQADVGHQKNEVWINGNQRWVSQIVYRKGDCILGNGDDKEFAHFKWRDETALLTDDYEVKPEEWLSLLVQLGGKLGTTAPGTRT
jgi:hypothetical protein